jgi:hypothetical protein
MDHQLELNNNSGLASIFTLDIRRSSIYAWRQIKGSKTKFIIMFAKFLEGNDRQIQ